MINVIVLDGIVFKTWKYADDLLFRIAYYRDPDSTSRSARNRSIQRSQPSVPA